MRIIVLHAKRFRVADVISALSLFGINIKDDSSDDDIIRAINRLSDDMEFWHLLYEVEIKND